MYGRESFGTDCGGVSYKGGHKGKVPVQTNLEHHPKKTCQW